MQLLAGMEWSSGQDLIFQWPPAELTLPGAVHSYWIQCHTQIASVPIPKVVLLLKLPFLISKQG